MGSLTKKETRKRFRDAVFKRDGYKCVVCGFKSSPEQVERELDAHHITPREEMPNGGYVRENGVSLCDPSKAGGSLTDGCHYRAEQMLLRLSQGWEPDTDLEYTPESLYEAIRSSREKAEQASERLTKI